MAAREFKKFQEFAQEAEQNPDRAIPFMSKHAMHFYDARTGESVVYGHRQLSAQDQIRLVGEKKNREYCWLLVEAYEEFEDYIERVYAFLGKRDPQAWPLADFGNVRWPELDSRDFGWYLETVKRKHRQRPKIILNRFRTMYPDLHAVERTNELDTNLQVALELIENLRHKIVHARGEVTDLEEFTKGVLEHCGLWNEGIPNEGYRAFVQRYFRPRTGGGHVVTLLEVRAAAPREMPLEIVHDVFGGLIGYLMNYAALIGRCVEGLSIQPES